MQEGNIIYIHIVIQVQYRGNLPIVFIVKHAMMIMMIMTIMFVIVMISLQYEV